MNNTSVEGVQPTLLLVDDNPTNLQVLYQTLEGRGYRLLVATNGHDALAIAYRQQPILVLLDIMMPGIDGFEVCQRLKADPATREIAVIFLSALEDTSAKVRGLGLGAVDYVAKPFQADEVVARVATHVKLRRLEQQLARRNEQLEADNQRILTSISEGIISVDAQGIVQVVNPAACRITGYRASDLIGVALASLHLFDQREGGGGAFEHSLPYRAFALGQAGASDVEYLHTASGPSCPVALSCAPIAEGGAVLVLRDIRAWIESEEALRSAREELERQRVFLAHMERLSTMGEMAAGIAHEVNQPLTAMANYSRVAVRLCDQDPLDRPRLQEVLRKLDHQAVRASEVIQHLRGYVRRRDGERSWIDIRALLHEVIALAEVDSRVNDVSVHLDARNDLPLIEADAIQIQQVALNLIRNGMEAMSGLNDRKDGVLVTALLEDDEVRIRVRDHGHGLAPDAEQHLFLPFYTTKSNGMGIGLSICQSIAHKHGGRIDVERNPEGGTTFMLRLPVAPDLPGRA